MRTWNVFFDGLVEPVNPGGVMAWGWAIDPGNGELLTGCGAKEEHPANTNNVAEYWALGHSIKAVLDLLAKPEMRATFAGLLIKGDSQLVVNQVNKQWAVKSPNLAPVHARILQLLADTQQPWAVEWVPREQNIVADSLSRRGYFERTGRQAPTRGKGAAA